MIIYIFPTRIKDARTSIINYGVDEKYVFKVEDVLHKRNTPKVVRCLEEVAKLVRKQIKLQPSINDITRLGGGGSVKR